MNIGEIRELILLLEQTSISELEVQENDFRLCLRKANMGTPASVSNNKTKAGSTITVEKEPEINDTAIEVLSPMVGTFYSSASPDSEPYIKIGDHVDSEQTLCIIEAMKLFNEIKSDFAGTIVNILVENAQPVEFGQLLFLMEKD